MKTATVEVGNLVELIAWILAALILIAGAKELKRFASFVLLKLYEYFIQQS